MVLEHVMNQKYRLATYRQFESVSFKSLFVENATDGREKTRNSSFERFIFSEQISGLAENNS